MITLSNRGYPMLRAFVDAGSSFHMSIAQAQHYDQRPFRSMLMRGWVAYKPGKGFALTKEGRRAWDEFLDTSIERKNHEAPLTAYFDPAAYGLGPRRKKQPAKLKPVANSVITLQQVRQELRTRAAM